jgi:spore photoproduct lyase
MWLPDEIWIERSELETPIARTVLGRASGRPVHIVDDPRAAETNDVAAGKRRLVLQRHRGTFLQACPAGTSGLVCCSYLVANFASNCPFDCSYCFLQEYLANNPAVKAFTNVGDALEEIDAILRAHTGRSFRIGTGELADSLALDPLTGLSSHLVRFFAERPNALLELKTKSDCVGELLKVDPKGRVVVAWSVNPPEVIESDEPGTASLDARLAAARRVQGAGYRLGFHFDPLVEIEDWEAGYRRTVEAIFSAVDAARVAWVSLGSLRLTPRLASIMRARREPPRVLGAELVPGPDGKARVWRGLRLRMYREMVGQLRARFPQVPVYLCMESPGVWQQAMQEVPTPRHLGARLAAPATW